MITHTHLDTGPQPCPICAADKTLPREQREAIHAGMSKLVRHAQRHHGNDHQVVQHDGQPESEDEGGVECADDSDGVQSGLSLPTVQQAAGIVHMFDATMM